MQRRSYQAFTLTELMIALAVISILIMVATPSYQQQVRQARRTDGQTQLMMIAVEQEKFRAHCDQYARILPGTSNCDPDAPAPYVLGSNDTSQEGHYSLSLSGVSATGFTAEATGVGNQARDSVGSVSCKRLTLDQDGNRSPRECW